MSEDSQYRATSLPHGAATQRMALLFLLLVVASMVGLDAWQSWTARTQALRTAEITTSNLARSLTQHAEDTVKESDTVLLGLVERFQSDGTSPAALARLRLMMQHWKGSLEQLHGLFIYDRNGNWLVTSNQSDPVGANNADRDYFQFHAKHADTGVRIGAVIRSRSTGDLIIPVSRRLNAADGSFAGVVLATLRLAYFNDFYREFDLDTDGVIVLALRDGTILARSPFDENVTGISLAKGKVFSELLRDHPVGSVMQNSLVDGIERLYSFRASQNYPLVVETAQTRTSIFAIWQQNLVRSALFVLMVIVALLLCTAALIRQIRHGQRTEAELRNAHAALQKLAMQDSLTGLANRRQMDAALPDEIGRARRNGRPLGLIMLDIDHFKRFNDLYGHPAGDECIKAVGQAVLGCVGRTADLVVRYGGEELLVLLPESDAAGTRKVAERILDAVRGLAIPHAGNDVGVVTISAGLHVWQNSQGNVLAQHLVHAADQALYQAKSAGRNRICPPAVTASDALA